MNETIEDIRASVLEILGEAHEVHVLSYTVENELLKLKRENAKLRKACTRLFDIAHAADLELDHEILDTGLVIELQKLGVDAEI
jgi:hypothetical protein